MLSHFDLCGDGSVSPHASRLIARFDSFDALFDALFSAAVPPLRFGGFVRVHPDRLSTGTAADLSALRQRVGAYGLMLLVTTLVTADAVELFHYNAPVGV